MYVTLCASPYRVRYTAYFALWHIANRPNSDLVSPVPVRHVTHHGWIRSAHVCLLGVGTREELLHPRRSLCCDWSLSGCVVTVCQLGPGTTARSPPLAASGEMREFNLLGSFLPPRHQRAAVHRLPRPLSDPLRPPPYCLPAAQRVGSERRRLRLVGSRSLPAEGSQRGSTRAAAWCR